jgi:hypothetical protein
MSNLGQGYWERRRVGGRHSHKGHRGNREVCRSLPTASFIPVVPLSVEGKLYDLDKIQIGSISGLVDFWQIISHLTLGRFFYLCFPIQSMIPNSHEFPPNKRWFMDFRGCGLVDCVKNGPVLPPDISQISSQPLHLSPTLRHLLKEQSISYPMHVSGHGWWSGCRDMLAQS